MPSTMLVSAAALVAFSSFASAHMAMIKPYPYHSTANPKVTWETADYSMTAPLVSNGLPYPCKGYSYTPSEGPKEQWTAGQTISVEIGGSAVHGGGSCQYSLSYDNGANFHVIESIIGGCLVDSKTFQVKIPDNAPGGTAIFAWSWFNKVGNREMYMNCLSADISSSSTTPLSTPTIFVANAAVNQCSTVEGVPVVFPNPGDNVVYGGEYTGKSIGNGLESGAGAVGTNCFAPGSDGAGSGGSSPAPAPATTVAAAATTSSAPAEVVPASSSAPAVVASSEAPVVSASSSAEAPFRTSRAEAVTTAAATTAAESPFRTSKATVPTTSSASVEAAAPTKQAGGNSDAAVPVASSAPAPEAAATTVSSAAAVEPTSPAPAETSSAAPVEATSAAVESVAPVTSSAPAAETTAAATTPATTAPALETTAAASSFVSVVVKASSAPVAEPTKAAEPEVVKCTTGEWKCVGQVLSQCAWDVWYNMADCSTQTGTVCNASTPVGCIWPFQVPGYNGAKKRHFGTNHHGHGRSRKRAAAGSPASVVESDEE